jgi:PhnB protein
MANIQLDAYLFFTGNCLEAMEFYKSVFGGDLKMQTYGEVPGEKPKEMEGHEDKVMHSLLSGGDIRLMASDSTRGKPFGRSFISLSLSGADEKRLQDIFDKLAKGGKVDEPLKKQFWGDTFGALTDKFGVEWMVNITSKKE